MGQYAKDTNVSPEQSLMEIRKTLTRYKATGFGIVEDSTRVGVTFDMEGRRVRFVVPLPDRDDKRFKYTSNNRYGYRGEFSEKLYEQGTRQKWRALLLTIKAKLESVESQIETFEEAFMAHLVLPDGRTMGEIAVPQIKMAYETKTMPPLLGSGK